jgi:peptidoglycan hydrolase-like protein with peptidoglycan-binding domain
MSLIERALFSENLHPRGTGAAGGQFVAKGSGSAAKTPAGQRAGARARKPRPAGNLAFDGRRGPGYGQKNGDKRVKNLQTALNRLGLTDSSGKRLSVDGKLGPKTTAAIKKAQRALGLKADGVVTPALLAKLTKARKLEKAKRLAAPVKKAMPAKKAAAPARKATPAPQRRGRGDAKAAPRIVQVGGTHGN